MSKKANVPPPNVHVRIAEVSVTSSLENAFAIIVYELGVFCARRKVEVHSFTTSNITYESNRMIGTELKPRVCLNILSNKEDKKGEIRDRSLHGTRETVFSCRCKGSHTNKIITGDCPIRAFETLWRHRTSLYEELKKTYKGREDFQTFWSKVKLLLRIKYNAAGQAVGFHAGGASHRGMSLRNIQKFYRKALVLGGMTEIESMKFSFHGARRAHVTFAKNFGGASDGEVVLGTKHAHGGTVPHYNDASRAQLSQPALFQGELRDKMKAVLQFKSSFAESKVQSGNPSTPPRPPGEVQRSLDTVSPTEVNRLTDFLNSKNINRTALREIESLKPGAADEVLRLAAEMSLGNQVQQPRFGIMGKIVRKLNLFEDSKDNSLSEIPANISNNFNAPVQIFNGPVYFGSSSDSVQTFSNKRSRVLDSNSSIPKRRLIETKEETFSFEQH